MKIFIFFLLTSFTAGLQIGCEFSYFYNLELYLTESFTCNVISIDFSTNSDYVTSVNESEFGLVETVTFGYFYVSCPQLNLNVIPKGLSSIFPNVTALLFYYCPVTHLFGDEFDEYSNLEVLMIQYFNIIRVPPELFLRTPKMKFVGFYNNEIQHVGGGLLEHLRSLQRVDFRGNYCVNQRAYNTSQLPSLIEHFRVNCTDIETTTTLSTTTTSLPITTTEAPRCVFDNFEDFVCGLDEEIEILKERIEKLEAQDEILTVKIEAQSEAIRNLAARLDELEQRP